MNWSAWEEVETILREHHLAPIAAVVPDNQDPHLRAGPPHAQFWERVREWQLAGWTIGLHGYQHLYVTKRRGLVGRRPLSEFAGLCAQEQRTKLARGLDILRCEGIHPSVWVAPGHTFDAVTVSHLLALGIRTISDGFSLFPYLDPSGMFWIPQQLWSLRNAPKGVWTVCHHINRWTTRDVDRFRAEVAKYAECLTSVEQVRARYAANPMPSWQRHLGAGPLAHFLIRIVLKCHALTTVSG